MIPTAFNPSGVPLNPPMGKRRLADGSEDPFPTAAVNGSLLASFPSETHLNAGQQTKRPNTAPAAGLSATGIHDGNQILVFHQMPAYIKNASSCPTLPVITANDMMDTENVQPLDGNYMSLNEQCIQDDNDVCHSSSSFASHVIYQPSQSTEPVWQHPDINRRFNAVV